LPADDRQELKYATPEVIITRYNEVIKERKESVEALAPSPKARARQYPWQYYHLTPEDKANLKATADDIIINRYNEYIEELRDRSQR
jgi:hypothetical protein